MTWLAWRQFAANALLAVVVTIGVVGVLAVTRGHVADVADPDALPAFIGAFWGAAPRATDGSCRAGRSTQPGTR